MEPAEKKQSKFLKLWVCLLIVIVAVVIAVLIVLATSRTEYFTNMQTRVTDNGTSLLVPEEWVSVPGRSATFTPPDVDEHMLPIQIKVSTNSQVTSEWSKMSRDDQKRIVDSLHADIEAGKFDDLEFESSKTTVINGNYGIIGETDESNSAFKTKAKGIAFVSVSPQGDLYKVVAMVPVDDFSANRSEMEEVVQSFRYVQN